MDTTRPFRVVPPMVMLLDATAREWLRDHPNASRAEKSAYRDAVNDVLCAQQRFTEAEILRKQLAKLFFPRQERNGE